MDVNFESAEGLEQRYADVKRRLYGQPQRPVVLVSKPPVRIKPKERIYIGLYGHMSAQAIAARYGVSYRTVTNAWAKGRKRGLIEAREKGKGSRVDFKPHECPPNAPKHARWLFELINRNQRTLRDVERKAGISRSSLAHWRKSDPQLSLIEAAYNTFGYTLVPVRLDAFNEDDLPWRSGDRSKTDLETVIRWVNENGKGMSLQRVLSKQRTREIVSVRHALFKYLRFTLFWSTPRIASVTGFDHSSVVTATKRWKPKS